MGVRPDTAAALHHWVATTQATARQPSLVGALGRRGSLVWCGGAGSIDGVPGGIEPGPHTAYRIASVTKTVVAVAVLQLVERGRIALSDKISDHVPDAPCGDATVAQLLSHTSGLQAETDGSWWERSPGYTWMELVAQGMVARHPAGSVFHYSNVGYAVLGRLLELAHEAPWDQILARDVLEPLGMTRTARCAPEGAATGWGVHPHAALLHHEPVQEYLAMGPAGELWSTPADLVVWGSFLAGATDGPLGAELLAQMRRPWAVADVPGVAWDTGHGLGLQVWNVGGRRFAGHTGSVPGFTCELRFDPESSDVCVVLGSATTGFGGAAGLLTAYQHAEPASPKPFVADPTQASALDLLGSWYWGTSHAVLTVGTDGGLDLVMLGPAARSTAFTAVDADRWVGQSGYFAGEPLTVVRDDAGQPVALDLASFRLSRTPYDPIAGQPGGVDDRGWH